MDYDSLFRPLYSFGAHAAKTASRGLDKDSTPSAIFADLQELKTGILSLPPRTGSAGFDQAWFAVSAWLGEILADACSRAGNTPSDLPFVRSANNDTEFFSRLDALLSATGQAEEPAARQDLIKVYASCLELGFRGKHRGMEGGVTLENYRRRCREVLGSGKKPVLFHPFVPRAEPPPAKSPGTLVFWFLLPAATLVMYFVYRLILSDLYSQAAG